MSWRYHGKAKLNPNAPSAWGRCDRCSFWYLLSELNYQMEWRGARLMNIRLRVCPKCTDRPYIFNRPLILPPDPVPKADPRPENFQIADNGSPTQPPLPWPQQSPGPVVPGAPQPPVYVTPPLPPLPPDIGLGYPNESEE